VAHEASSSTLDKLKESLGSAWPVFRDHWFGLNCVGFLRDLVSLLAAMATFAVLVDFKGWNIVIALLVRCVVWSGLQAGYLKLLLHLCEKNEVDLQDLFASVALAFQFLMGAAIYVVASVFGCLLLLVPGFIFASRLSMFGFLMADGERNPIRALSESNRLMRGSTPLVASFIVIYILANYCCLGAVVDLVMQIAVCKLYRQAKEREVTV
jgi:hypothetical protein